MADRKAQAACLNTLEVSINSILLNIGTVFQSKLDGDSERLAEPKRRLRSAIPPALDDFHAALDALEAELIRAKAVMSRDLAIMQAASEAPATPPKSAESEPVAQRSSDAANGEPSQLDQSAFELINDPDVIMADSQDASANSDQQRTNQTADAVKMEKTDSKSGGAAPASGPQSQAASDSKPAQPDAKAAAVADEAKKPLTPATDGQGNNPLGIHVEAAVKGEGGHGGSKTSPKDQSEHASDNGFNELLPGLSMYANDPNSDPTPMLDMGTLNDQSLSNAFGEGGDSAMDEFEQGLFGDGGDMSGGMGGNGNSFADMISFDNTSGQNEDTHGALDVFDEDFFNLSGE